jgi:hypothetical protein
VTCKGSSFCLKRGIRCPFSRKTLLTEELRRLSGTANSLLDAGSDGGQDVIAFDIIAAVSQQSTIDDLLDGEDDGGQDVVAFDIVAAVSQ